MSDTLVRTPLLIERSELTVDGQSKKRDRDLPKSRLGNHRRTAEKKILRRISDNITSARTRHNSSYQRRGSELFKSRLSRTPLRYRLVGLLR